MTKEDFLEKKTEIREKYIILKNELIAEQSKEENILIKQYLDANKKSKYKLGDIVEGQGIIIKIEKITYDYNCFTHDIVIRYYGVMLTKKLNKYKSGKIESILESNVQRHITNDSKK